MQLASRASHTRSPSHLPRALTHAAASWPAVPPTSDDASGVIVDWRFTSPCWLLSGSKPAGSNGWGARRHVGRGTRHNGCWVNGLWFWFWVCQWLIGRHAEAVVRLNCQTSAMVIHTNLGINLL